MTNFLVHYYIIWAIIKCQFQKIWYFPEKSPLKMAYLICFFKQNWLVCNHRRDLAFWNSYDSEVTFWGKHISVVNMLEFAEHSLYVIL